MTLTTAPALGAEPTVATADGDLQFAPPDARAESTVSPRTVVLVLQADLGWVTRLTAALQSAGLSVHTASDGLSGLQLLEQLRPDVVVLDLELPVLSGFRLMHVLRQTASRPLLMIVTTLTFEEAADALRLGADGFLTTPCSPQQVVTQVEQLLLRSRRH